MRTDTIIFDIETGPLPQAELYSQFDPLDVKLGNIKDPAKVQAKVDSARAEFYDRAALCPLTGRVLAIGYKCGNEYHALEGTSEAEMLNDWWGIVRAEMGRCNRMVGFNTHTFDWPFLIKRSWKYGITIPLGVRRGRYFGEELVDIRECWQLGDRQAHGSLDKIARHLGLGGKTGSGELFHRLYTDDKAAAMAYLKNDVELTEAVGKRIGVI